MSHRIIIFATLWVEKYRSHALIFPFICCRTNLLRNYLTQRSNLDMIHNTSISRLNALTNTLGIKTDAFRGEMNGLWIFIWVCS